jgi:hypothetical protein
MCPLFAEKTELWTCFTKKHQNTAALKYIAFRSVKKYKQKSYDILRTYGSEIDEKFRFSNASRKAGTEIICSVKKRNKLDREYKRYRDRTVVSLMD